MVMVKAGITGADVQKSFCRIHRIEIAFFFARALRIRRLQYPGQWQRRLPNGGQKNKELDGINETLLRTQEPVVV